MKVAYDVFLVIALIVSVVFAALVFLTGKGDAMSGGSSVRTSFKGKAGFDDFISKLTLMLGVGFMALMLLVDVLGNRLEAANGGLPALPNAAPEGQAPTGSAPTGGTPPVNETPTTPPATP